MAYQLPRDTTGGLSLPDVLHDSTPDQRVMILSPEQLQGQGSELERERGSGRGMYVDWGARYRLAIGGGGATGIGDIAGGPHLTVSVPRYNDHLQPQATESVIQPLLLTDPLTTRGGGRPPPPLAAVPPRTRVNGAAPGRFPPGQTVLPLNEVLESSPTRRPIQTGRISCTDLSMDTVIRVNKIKPVNVGHFRGHPSIGASEEGGT